MGFVNMIVKIAVGKFGKGVVWLSELPTCAIFKAQSIVESVNPSAGNHGGMLRQAAIELNIPKGPRSEYGLLGGTFQPDSSMTLRTYIHTTSFFGPTYPSTVAIGSEVTHIGIPLEYEPGISSGIEDAISVRSALPSGELRFDRGVHGEIGSDSLIFRYLSYIVFGLFEFIEECPDDDLITSFVYKSLCTKLQNERSAMLRSEIEFGQERSRMESTI